MPVTRIPSRRAPGCAQLHPPALDSESLVEQRIDQAVMEIDPPAPAAQHHRRTTVAQRGALEEIQLLREAASRSEAAATVSRASTTALK